MYTCTGRKSSVVIGKMCFFYQYSLFDLDSSEAWVRGDFYDACAEHRFHRKCCVYRSSRSLLACRICVGKISSRIKKAHVFIVK